MVDLQRLLKIHSHFPLAGGLRRCPHFGPHRRSTQEDHGRLALKMNQCALPTLQLAMLAVVEEKAVLIRLTRVQKEKAKGMDAILAEKVARVMLLDPVGVLDKGNRAAPGGVETRIGGVRMAGTEVCQCGLRHSVEPNTLLCFVSTSVCCNSSTGSN